MHRPNELINKTCQDTEFGAETSGLLDRVKHESQVFTCAELDLAAHILQLISSLFQSQHSGLSPILPGVQSARETGRGTPRGPYARNPGVVIRNEGCSPPVRW